MTQPAMDSKEFDEILREQNEGVQARKFLHTDNSRDDGVKPPFRLTATGVEYAQEKEGEIEWQFVCSRLEVVAATRNTEGEEWGRLLSFRDDDGKLHQWAMPMEMLAGDGVECRERLLSMGLHIAPGPKARHRLHDYIITTMPRARARAVDHLGWHDKIFVYPDAVYGRAGDELVIHQTVNPIEHTFRCQGTLADWQTKVAALCAGNSRLVFGISLAFAAPLLFLTDSESGGFHLRGPSSIGKSTLLDIAGSVTGGGPRGYRRSWRTTANGLEAVAAAHCDSLLCLDELSEVSSKDAGEAAYMLANGHGKGRARQDGSGRPQRTWRTIFLSSGELSLGDKVAEDGRRRVTAGQELRVIDLPADAGSALGIFERLNGARNGHEFSMSLRAACSQFYGTAIREFLTKCTESFDDTVAAIKSFEIHFLKTNCTEKADGQVKRAAERFALAAAAGELATAFGIVPWDAGEATKGAATCFNAWLSNRPAGTGRAEIEAGFAQIRKFFEMHGESRFTLWDKREGDDSRTNERPTINRAGFRRLNGDGSEVEFYVFPEVFQSELCAGFDTKALTKALIEKRLLIPSKDGRSAESVTLPQLGKKRVYHFASRVFAGDEHE